MIDYSHDEEAEESGLMSRSTKLPALYWGDIQGDSFNSYH